MAQGILVIIGRGSFDLSYLRSFSPVKRILFCEKRMAKGILPAASPFLRKILKILARTEEKGIERLCAAPQRQNAGLSLLSLWMHKLDPLP